MNTASQADPEPRPISEVEKLERELAPLSRLAGMFKYLLWASGSVVAFLFGIAVWVTQQTTAIANNTASISEIVTQRTRDWKDLTDWRAGKDRQDVRITTILEQQQKLIEQAGINTEKLQHAVAKLPVEFPPGDFRKRVDAMESRLEGVQRQLERNGGILEQLQRPR